LIQAEKILSISRASVKVALKDFPKEVITAEEILRHRVQTFLRVALATVFFWLSGLISIGATAIAQAATKDQPVKTKTASRHRNHHKSVRQDTDPNLSMNGTASWYGHKFHNRKTASGKTFNQNSLMAAHRTLPFGTLVKVTNKSNNRSCIVEITDRGPYVKHRIIDVSRSAAQELGFAGEGTAKVSLEVITPLDLSYSHSKMRKQLPLSDVLRTPEMAVQTASGDY
jgi:rare lipoprotein A